MPAYPDNWKQVTPFAGGRVIVALEAHPSGPLTLWLAATTWEGDVGLYRTRQSAPFPIEEGSK